MTPIQTRDTNARNTLITPALVVCFLFGSISLSLLILLGYILGTLQYLGRLIIAMRHNLSEKLERIHGSSTDETWRDLCGMPKRIWDSCRRGLARVRFSPGSLFGSGRGRQDDEAGEGPSLPLQVLDIQMNVRHVSVPAHARLPGSGSDGPDPHQCRRCTLTQSNPHLTPRDEQMPTVHVREVPPAYTPVPTTGGTFATTSPPCPRCSNTTTSSSSSSTPHPLRAQVEGNPRWFEARTSSRLLPQLRGGNNDGETVQANHNPFISPSSRYHYPARPAESRSGQVNAVGQRVPRRSYFTEHL